MASKSQSAARSKSPRSESARKPRSVSSLLDSQLAQTVRDSAQQIWLAGMGAFGKAQGEGGRFFETLVKEGLNLQRRTQGVAEDKLSEVGERMSAMAGSVSAKAGQNWDKLETLFEERTAKALGKLGVPSAKDVEVLTQRVEQLAAAVARLAGAEGRTRAKGEPKRAARTSAQAAAKGSARGSTRGSSTNATQASTATPTPTAAPARKTSTPRAPRKTAA